MSLLAVAVVIALVLLGAGWPGYLVRLNQRARRNRRGILSTRPLVSVDEWFQVHAAPLGLPRRPCSAVVQGLANALGCHPTQVRPSDRFDRELAFAGIHIFGIDSDDEIEQFFDHYLPLELDKHGIIALEERNTPFATVADVIEFVEPYLIADGGNHADNQGEDQAGVNAHVH